MHKRPRVSISSRASVAVRRWCRRRAAVAARDSSAVRIRSNRKFHPLLGWERAALRTRLAVEQVDSPSRTKRRASASKRDRMPTVSPSRSQVRKRQRGGSWGDAAEAQPLRPRAVGVKAAAVAAAAATSSAPHDGWNGGWACNPTRHPGIRTGTTHKVHRAGPATPRATSQRYFLPRDAS